MSIEETTLPRPRFESGLGFLLSRVGAIVDAAWSTVLAEHDLSNAQYNVLAVLAEFGPTTQKHLARRVAVDPRNVVKTVGALTARELVSTEPAGIDGRVKTLAITDAGREVLGALMAALPPHRRRFTRTLSTTEEGELTRLLKRLYADHVGG